jgi:hypothetical protein
MKRSLLITAMFGLTLHAQQQKSMGTVATTDAQLSGGLEVDGQRARLITNASVTAKDHTAQIDLDRGGDVQVCATSAFHLLRSGSGDALLFALDRGAMVIETASRPQDAILTPDLRFTMLTAGPLDLRMRVTREGDTCVDNHGDGAPVLQITEGFGTGIYHLSPNQHVLFEHGSLREVVDHERSDCGCPGSTPVMVAAGTGNATSTPSPQQVAALNPFPAAQSADLSTAKPAVPLPPAGNAQPVALTYGDSSAAPQPTAVAQPASEAKPVSPIVAALPALSGPPPPTPPGAHDIFHSIGRFFRRLFGGKS